MKNVFAVLLLSAIAFGQAAPVTDAPYWTSRRISETAGVTLLHMADAANTCYRMSHGAMEYGFGTPRNCPAAAAYLVSLGPATQWLSYRMTRRYPNSRLWRMIDTGLPHLEMTISSNAIRCSSQGGCNRYGF